MSSRPPPRSASFHGAVPGNSDPAMTIPRTESHPELQRLRAAGGTAASSAEGGGGGQRLTKLLLNVTIERSPGPVHVVISPEYAVADLIRAAVQAYAKEGRRPLLPQTDPNGFELHYSQYSLESLDPKEKLINLGSRNFFLCSKPNKIAVGGGGLSGQASKRASEHPLALNSTI